MVGLASTVLTVLTVLTVFVPATARGATEWIKLPPEQVVAEAQLVAVGRFEAAVPGQGRGVVAHGLVWQLVPFTVDYYAKSPGVMQRLSVGVEPDRVAAVAGRRYLVLLEQQRGEWLTLGGPNGLVPLDGDEPRLDEPREQQYYGRYLAGTKHYPPVGKGSGSGPATPGLGLAAVLAVLAGLALVGARQYARRKGERL